MDAIIVVRVADYNSAVFAGTRKTICKRCHEPVYVSPESQRLMSMGIPVICERCIEPDEIARVEITEGTRKEVEQWLNERHRANTGYA